jgi:hypothetical protein
LVGPGCQKETSKGGSRCLLEVQNTASRIVLARKFRFEPNPESRRRIEHALLGRERCMFLVNKGACIFIGSWITMLGLCSRNSTTDYKSPVFRKSMLLIIHTSPYAFSKKHLPQRQAKNQSIEESCNPFNIQGSSFTNSRNGYSV